jgi:LacI family transcriptional regulator
MSASVVTTTMDGRAQVDQHLADRLHARLQPIFFHGFPGLSGVIQLGTDLHASLAMPVRHLARQGHTRIGLVLGDTRSIWFQARLQGYLDALHEAGIGFAPERVVVMADPADAASGDAELDRLLGPASGITALACATDRHALAVLERCRRLGIRVPDDLAVTGSDDIPESRLSLPPLTSVSGRDRDKGAFAAELLQRRLGGETLEPVEHRFEPQLIVRASSQGGDRAKRVERPRAAGRSRSKQVG